VDVLLQETLYIWSGVQQLEADKSLDFSNGVLSFVPECNTV